MEAAQQMSQLAFHLGARGAVVVPPGGVCLSVTGPGQLGLIGTNMHAAAALGGGAPWRQRAAAAGWGEVCDPALTVRVQRGRVPGGTGDLTGSQVDGERVL